jgi:hypothetical protein
VQGLGLRNLSEWLRWARSEARPGFIPANPSVIYKHRGWVDIGDWLGIDRVSRYGENPCRKPRADWRSLRGEGICTKHRLENKHCIVRMVAI